MSKDQQLIIDKSNFGRQKPRIPKPVFILSSVPYKCNINNPRPPKKTKPQQPATKNLAVLGSQRESVLESGNFLNWAKTVRSGCLQETIYQIWQLRGSY